MPNHNRLWSLDSRHCGVQVLPTGREPYAGVCERVHGGSLFTVPRLAPGIVVFCGLTICPELGKESSSLVTLESQVGGKKEEVF